MDSFLCSIETAPATVLPIALEAKSFSANNGLRVGCRQDEGVVCLLFESAINTDSGDAIAKSESIHKKRLLQ